MMFDVRIELGRDSTQVAVRLNVLHDVGPLLSGLLAGRCQRQVVIVTDTRVQRLHSAPLFDSLSGAGFETLTYEIQPGEASKTVSVASDIYRFLWDHAVARDAVIVALGGGVVSDLAGFVAATWMRGVRFVVCPTTLEADVDASIGGKTAVNLPEGKNLVGAFHHPLLVAVDLACLHTLDARDVRAGLAESIKHALLFSEEFLAWHEDNADAILALDDERIRELIVRNVRHKARIVERDAREEQGTRMLLNFGHTIGHAIEACCAFTLRHGECVSLGMLAACRLSRALGLLDESVVERVADTLRRFGLPTRLPKPIDTGPIMTAIRRDKKIRRGAQQLVLLQGVGRPTIRDDVAEQQLRKAYESLLP